MVEYHVQNHLDPRAVKSAHHLLEFELLLTEAARAAVGGLRRAEDHGVVTPILVERLAAGISAQEGAFVKFLHRHQFHRRDP